MEGCFCNMEWFYRKSFEHSQKGRDRVVPSSPASPQFSASVIPHLPWSSWTRRYHLLFFLQVLFQRGLALTFHHSLE